jgi:hypothetical protein
MVVLLIAPATLRGKTWSEWAVHGSGLSTDLPYLDYTQTQFVREEDWRHPWLCIGLSPGVLPKDTAFPCQSPQNSSLLYRGSLPNSLEASTHSCYLLSTPSLGGAPPLPLSSWTPHPLGLEPVMLQSFSWLVLPPWTCPGQTMSYIVGYRSCLVHSRCSIITIILPWDRTVCCEPLLPPTLALLSALRMRKLFCIRLVVGITCLRTIMRTHHRMLKTSLFDYT